jgi:hypothetical protein
MKKLGLALVTLLALTHLSIAQAQTYAFVCKGNTTESGPMTFVAIKEDVGFRIYQFANSHQQMPLNRLNLGQGQMTYFVGNNYEVEDGTLYLQGVAETLVDSIEVPGIILIINTQSMTVSRAIEYMVDSENWFWYPQRMTYLSCALQPLAGIR